jgi:hypothetical protein
VLNQASKRTGVNERKIEDVQATATSIINTEIISMFSQTGRIRHLSSVQHIKLRYFATFAVLMTVTVKNTVLWDVTPCSLVVGCTYLGGTCCLHCPKKDAADSSER